MRGGLAARSSHRRRSASPSPAPSCHSSSGLSNPFLKAFPCQCRTCAAPPSPHRRPLSGSASPASVAVAPVQAPAPVPSAFRPLGTAVRPVLVSVLPLSHLFFVVHYFRQYSLFSPPPQPAVPQPPSRHFLFSPPPFPGSVLRQAFPPPVAGIQKCPPCAPRAFPHLPQGLSANP